MLPISQRIIEGSEGYDSDHMPDAVPIQGASVSAIARDILSGYDSDQAMFDTMLIQDACVSEATERNNLKRKHPSLEDTVSRTIKARTEGSDLPTSSPPSSPLEEEEDPSEGEETSSSESDENQAENEKSAPKDRKLATIYDLRPDERNSICSYIDGVSAKNLRLVSKDWYKAVDSRGHIKFKRLRFDFDCNFGDKDLLETQEEYENLNLLIRKIFYKTFKKFLKKLTNLQWVDLSTVDDKLNKIIPLLVNNNPSIRHLDLASYVCIEEDVEKAISRADLMLIGEKCKNLTSLVLGDNYGDYGEYLINKPPTAFSNLGRLVLLNYHCEAPLLFFKHILFAYPNLQELVVVDCINVDFSRTFDSNDTCSLMHLTHLTLADNLHLTDEDTNHEELGDVLQSIYAFCPNLSHLTFGNNFPDYDQLATLAESTTREMTIVLRIKGLRQDDERLAEIVRDNRHINFVIISKLPLPHYYA
jgi:hypothetical protein